MGDGEIGRSGDSEIVVTYPELWIWTGITIELSDN